MAGAELRDSVFIFFLLLHPRPHPLLLAVPNFLSFLSSKTSTSLEPNPLYLLTIKKHCKPRWILLHKFCLSVFSTWWLQASLNWLGYAPELLEEKIRIENGKQFMYRLKNCDCTDLLLFLAFLKESLLCGLSQDSLGQCTADGILAFASQKLLWIIFLS